MTPKSQTERIFRDEILEMAATEPFARRLVNSGRLSVPCSLAGLSLISRDDPAFAGGLEPGSPCLDAPVTNAAGKKSWLLRHLGGTFTLMSSGVPVETPDGVEQLTIGRDLEDAEGYVASRYGGTPGSAYLIRPDQHVAARFASPTPENIRIALARARGSDTP